MKDDSSSISMKAGRVRIGLRSLFFDPTGSAAWVVDTHAIYMYNGGVPKDIHTFRHER